MDKKAGAQDNQGIMIMNAVKPEIAKCEMLDCAFNGNSLCHAIAINVGAEHQQCDTYAVSRQKAGANMVKGGVGACKVTHCAFNRDMLCSAGNIVIKRHETHGDCGRFMERQAVL